MFGPKFFTVIGAVTFSLVSAAPAARTAYSKAPVCRAEGEKCKGADYKPFVEWINCCEGSCDKPAEDWGYVCSSVKKSHYHHQCRPEGEKCRGADGHPAVDWVNCCEGSCEKPASDWGYVCSKGYLRDEPVVEYTEPAYVQPKPVYVEEKHVYAPKCLAKNAQCGGSYSSVDCCKGTSCESAGWGKYGTIYKCIAPVYKPAYEPKPKAPKCLAKGAVCGKGYQSCCKGTICNKGAYGKASKCAAPVYITKTPKGKVTTPKCLARSAACGKGYESCCEGMTCEVAAYGKESKCVAPEAYKKMAPKTAAPIAAKCIAADAACGGAYDEKCCKGSKCESTSYGTSKKCVVEKAY